MKRVFVTVCAAVATAACGADILDELMPVPVRVERTGGAAPATARAKVRVVTGSVAGAPAKTANEAYALEIAPDGVTITAPGPEAERWARVTLAQLGRLAGGGGTPACRIADWPRFPLRGLMLDCGRNYLSLETIRDMIGFMSAYKMNVFHWHLTDYFGWRLESKVYPQLQSDQATTRFPGRYYTQKEFRELIDHAAARGVIVIPEFDVPGHTLAFRRAFGFEKMNEPRVKGIILDLIDELCALAPPATMPYIHLGTDEVNQETKGNIDDVPDEWIDAWAARVAEHGRKLIGWWPGQTIKSPGKQIKEVWGWSQYSRYDDRPEIAGAAYPYLDSTDLFYPNHADPFELLNASAFQTPCPWGPEEKKLGAMLSVWHDDRIVESADIVRQIAVYPGIVLLSDNFWRGRDPGTSRRFLSRLPYPDDPLFARAADIERRVIAQRDRVLTDLKQPFPFVAQTGMRWRLTVGGETFAPIAQGTVYPHRPLFEGSFYGPNEGTAVLETWIRSPEDRTVGVWIGATAFARSGGRYVDGPVPPPGEWNRHGATVEVNGERVRGPDWKNPGAVGKASREIPLTNEDYFYREPTPVRFRKGWNHVKLTLPKPPSTDPSQKWVGTFVPVAGTSEHPREVGDLEYSAEPMD